MMLTVWMLPDVGGEDVRVCVFPDVVNDGNGVCYLTLVEKMLTVCVLSWHGRC